MEKAELEEVHDLPYDMVFEIFSYLPAKQICKFRCTNRVINDVTSTSNFSSRQSSNVKTSCGLFIQDHYQNVNDLVLLSDDEEDESNMVSCSSGVPEDFKSGDDSIIVGISNGIVVYEEKLNYVGLGQLCIINPVTLQHRTIPRPAINSTTRLLGSIMMLAEQEEGRHNVDYNLVCFLPTGDWDNYVEYHVYSSTEDRWMEGSKERLDVGCRNLKYERPILVENTIYIVSDCYPAFKSEPYIVAIDVEQVGSEILALPAPLISCDYKIEIANWGDHHDASLCLICWCKSNYTFTLWIMEDRKKWTWSKSTVEITMESMGLERFTEEGEVTCFTLINGDKLVFNIGNAIHVYGLKDGRRRKLKKELSGGYLTLFPYANTLCPC